MLLNDHFQGSLSVSIVLQSCRKGRNLGKRKIVKKVITLDDYFQWKWQWLVLLPFKGFENYPLLSLFSTLRKFWVRQSKGKCLASVLQESPDRPKHKNTVFLGQGLLCSLLNQGHILGSWNAVFRTAVKLDRSVEWGYVKKPQCSPTTFKSSFSWSSICLVAVNL